MFGIAYVPESIRPCRIVGTPVDAVERYAPRFAHTLARKAVMVPSFLAAISTSWTWSRPWIVAL
jgi:hypothetical protein